MSHLANFELIEVSVCLCQTRPGIPPEPVAELKDWTKLTGPVCVGGWSVVLEETY